MPDPTARDGLEVPEAAVDALAVWDLRQVNTTRTASAALRRTNALGWLRDELDEGGGE